MNKKLFKIAICGIPVILGCITACSAISSIKTNDTTQDVVPSNALPYEVYEIDESNVLLGFKAGIDLDQYHDGIVNTMEIPSKVTSIDAAAFFENAKSTIPSFIKNLTFGKQSKCTTIGFYSFRLSTLIVVDLSNATNLEKLIEGAFTQCSVLTSVTFPSSLTLIGNYAFYINYSLNSIIWNSWNSTATVEATAFYSGLPAQGTVLVTNPIGSNNSAALLAYLKTKGLPNGWTVA